MGCGQSKVGHESPGQGDAQTTVVSVKPAAAVGNNQTPVEAPPQKEETAVQSNTDAPPTPYTTVTVDAAPASSSTEAASSDFHSISSVPPPTISQSLAVPKKKKRGDTIGMGKQAGARDLSTQLTVVSSADSERAMALFDRFLSAIHAVSAAGTNVTSACEIIIEQACRVLECQRATLFFVDNDTNELELVVAKGAKNIRLPKSKGIAGHCATTGETVVISDAHLDPRFDSSHDAASGFRTRAVIACPVRNGPGEIVGVLMCINKIAGENDTTGEFGQMERVLAENFASHTGLILANSQLYEESRVAQRKVETLLDIVQLLHSDPNTNSLIFTLSNRAPTLVDADRCTLYLVHKPTSTLVVQQGNIDIRVPFSKGIAGAVATTGTLINIPDCYQDSRFDQSIDKKTGYHTKAMACMPIFGPKRGMKPHTPEDVIGVLQVINKKDDSTFGEQDERLLTTLLELSGPILAASSFFSQQSTPMSEAEKMKSSPSPRAAGSSLTGGSSTSDKKSKKRGAPGNMRRVTEADIEMSEDDIKAAQLAQLGEEDEGEEEETE